MLVSLFHVWTSGSVSLAAKAAQLVNCVFYNSVAFTNANWTLTPILEEAFLWTDCFLFGGWQFVAI